MGGLHAAASNVFAALGRLWRRDLAATVLLVRQWLLPPAGPSEYQAAMLLHPLLTTKYVIIAGLDGGVHYELPNSERAHWRV
jgi:hypothetical protein